MNSDSPVTPRTASDHPSPNAITDPADFELRSDTAGSLDRDLEDDNDGDYNDGFVNRRAHPATTQREIWGWYAYQIAAEVFAVCGVGSFLPVTLEQLARERGVLFSDPSTPCTGAGAPTEPVASDGDVTQNLARRVVALVLRQTDANPGEDQCIIRPAFLGGREITTAAFAMYTFSIAVIVQVLVLVSLGSFGDYQDYRKRLLLGFGYTGAVASCLFIFVGPRIYELAPLLVVVGVACLGSSFAVLNSFLPGLVKNDPSISRVEDTDDPTSPSERSDDATYHQDDVQEHTHDPQSAKSIELSTHLSSTAVALGYIAAVTVQILSILLLLFLSQVLHVSSHTLPLRLILFIVGLWWLAFSIPTSLWLLPRPGPPLPSLSSSSRIRVLLHHISLAWSRLFRTLRLAITLHHTLLFLVAWFLLSDAIATVSGTAILFARTTLHLSTIAIAALSITATTSGILGAWAWPRIQHTLHLSSTHTIIAMILAMELIPLYALLPLLFPLLPVGGLQAWWEIYPLAVLHGFVMGGLSAYCRAFFAQLVPPGMEATFFALYAVTDKGSSAIGPAIVGAIVDHTGEIRRGFVFLAVLVLAPAPVVWCVDVEKGRRDARRMSGSKEEYGGVEEGVELQEQERGALLAGDHHNSDDEDGEDVQGEDDKLKRPNGQNHASQHAIDDANDGDGDGDGEDAEDWGW